MTKAEQAIRTIHGRNYDSSQGLLLFSPYLGRWAACWRRWWDDEERRGEGEKKTVDDENGIIAAAPEAGAELIAQDA